MRTLIYITALFFFTFSSCEQASEKKTVAQTEKEWTPERIRKHFKENIAQHGRGIDQSNNGTLNDFDNFSKRILKNVKAKNNKDYFILAFDEDHIDTTKIDKNKKWFRIYVSPAFRIPYCLVIEQFDKESELTLKMINGYGGQYYGFLNFYDRQRFSDSLYSEISKELHQLNFWSLTEDPICSGGTDGERWTFEAIENGKYNILTRWRPLSCGNQTTKRLAEIGVKLRNKAKFKEYLYLKTEIPKNIIERHYPDK